MVAADRETLSNRVVVRYRDGSRKKGYCYDFSANKDFLHLYPVGNGTRRAERILLDDRIKAVFFVKDFVGTPGRKKRYEDAVVPGSTYRVEVKFDDGERMIGTAAGFDPERKCVLLVPSDPGGNNLRALVPTHCLHGTETR